jgi:DNA repair exonuclease SbcCD ATPase subunit
MIEPGHIEQLLRKRFMKLSVISPCLFKASETYNDRLLGLYFFDCGPAILEPGFDLDSYQDRVLSDEYYRQSGSLQWNIYLYFICEPESYKELLESGELAAIESNKVFSRKYVTTENQLARELIKPTDLSKTGQNYPLDISSRWIEKLRSRQLDGVFMDVPRTRVVERYMSGQPIIETEKYESIKETHRSFLSPISQLKLVKFRRYPNRDNFEFGRCNLVVGPNGSGKTSLLEAIELWVCGRTLRNNKDIEQAKIGILFEDGETIEWNTPATNALYRSRDLLWYGNPYPKGNQLCVGFNRFNFYNTDAGVSISDEDEQTTIRNKIAALVLGETANKIEVRLNKILQLFTQEEVSLQKDLNLLNRQVQDSQSELNALLPSKEKEEHILERFRSHLKSLGWNGSIPLDDSDSLDSFLQEFTKTSAAILECVSELDWLADISLRDLKDEGEKLSDILKRVEQANSEINESDSLAKSLLRIIENLTTELQYLNEIGPYIHNPDSEKLPGLHERLRQCQARLSNCTAAKDKIAEVDLSKYLSSTESIREFEQSLDEQINTVAEEVNLLKKTATELGEQRNRLSRLRAEIRSGVLEMLETLPTVTQCPVCGALYEEGKLSTLVSVTERETDPTGESTVLREILQRLSSRESHLELLMKSLGHLRSVKAAISLIAGVKEPFDIPIKEVAARLSDIDHLIEKATRELDELKTLKDRLANEGLVEEQYVGLKQRLASTSIEQTLISGSIQAFNRLLSQKENSLEELRTKEKKCRDTIADWLQRKENGLRAYFDTMLPGDMEAELRKRSLILEQQKIKLEEHIEKFENGDQKPLNSLKSVIGEIEAAHERYVKSKKQLEESTSLRKRNETKINEASETIERTLERKSRADIAIKTIEDILLNDSKEQSLADFLGVNTTEIGEAFRLIHSPREFSQIEFDAKDKGILLSREPSGEKAQITRISSGQRTALALSMFLTLNRKLKNGPPFLIFDDPVAHVDDLNVLSFLDYLREVVLNLDRQVFFATANDKVAYLFKKKFDFLGPELRVYDLSRTPIGKTDRGIARDS